MNKGKFNNEQSGSMICLLFIIAPINKIYLYKLKLSVNLSCNNNKIEFLLPNYRSEINSHRSRNRRRYYLHHLHLPYVVSASEEHPFRWSFQLLAVLRRSNLRQFPPQTLKKTPRLIFRFQSTAKLIFDI